MGVREEERESDVKLHENRPASIVIFRTEGGEGRLPDWGGDGGRIFRNFGDLCDNDARASSLLLYLTD